MNSDVLSQKWKSFTENLTNLLPQKDLSSLSSVSATIKEKEKEERLILSCEQGFFDLIETDLSVKEFDIFKQCINVHFGKDIKIEYIIRPVPAKTHQSVNKNIFMDRNLSRNPTSFQIYGEDSTLVFSILLYIFKNNITIDLFGNTRIDPYDFSTFSGYTRTHLFRLVDEPAQIKRWLRINKRNKKEYTEKDYEEAQKRCLEQERYLFTTVFENALYRMMTENLVFGRDLKSSIYENEHMAIKKEGNQIVGLEAIQLIKYVTIVSNNERGKTSKKYYDVKFDALLRTNMLAWFSIIQDRPIQRAIGTNKRDSMPFYLWLQDLREICRKKGEVSINPEFDVVIKQAGINNTLEPKHQRQKLIKVLKTVMCYDDTMILKLVKKGRYEYQPHFMFIGNMDVAKEINTHKCDLCYQDFIIDLKKLYKDQIQKSFDEYINKDFQLFSEWLRNEDNFDNKKKIFIKNLDFYFSKRAKNFDEENFIATIKLQALSVKKLF